jgi:hypothetical protein
MHSLSLPSEQHVWSIVISLISISKLWFLTCVTHKVYCYVRTIWNWLLRLYVHIFSWALCFHVYLISIFRQCKLLWKMAVFWVLAPCILVEDYRRFRGPCFLHHPGSSTHRPDDGGGKNLWNMGKLVPDYTALQSRRRPSLYSPPWEPQILLLCFTNIRNKS